MKKFITLAMIFAWASFIWHMTESWLLWILKFPGTVFHEFMHFTMATALNGHPRGFDVIPSYQGSYWLLGSVEFTSNWYNSAAIALAPFLLLPLAFIIGRLAMRSAFRMWCILTYVAATFLSSGIPSFIDFGIVANSPASWLPALGIFSCLGLIIFFYLRYGKFEHATS